jgi:SAM-dependent methyltransferase
MHQTAHIAGKCFFDTYCADIRPSVVEIGSQNINGSLRDHAHMASAYIGVDFAQGKGVDLVLQDPYKFPFDDNTFDVLVTSSCFEHSEMFWLSFLEGLRILKPEGIMYCNAPSNNMDYHRYPVDCWRFMPDSARALQTWAKHNGLEVAVTETFTVCPLENSDSYCYDWCAVFVKDKRHMHRYTQRMINTMPINWVNGFKFYTPQGDWSSPIYQHSMFP